MGEFVAAIQRIERAEETFSKLRASGGNVIEMTTGQDRVKLNPRGNPVVDLATVFDHADRFFEADPLAPGRWREIRGTEVPGTVDMAHSHYKAELIEVRNPGRPPELYLSIPKAAAIRRELLGWEGRPEK